MNRKKYIILLAVQLLLVLITGMVSKDIWYVVLISLTGVVFNFLVSLNIPAGFLFGVVYAVTNGILSFTSGIYASAIFMIFIQAPMGGYSFISWRKKKQSGNAIMKKMTAKKVVMLVLFMMILGVCMYFVLKSQNGVNVFFDNIFFVFSVSACILLALCYKNAYIVTFCSGAGGTVLWFIQMMETGKGLSVAAFYLIVAVNSLVAIYEQYVKDSPRE